ncbi:hypothetical protein [Enterococcus timonensis]|uniref:hypothetical protein n=1 Tax=Enterococcus timonensis TaxID=1852364 RepID=UPI001319DBD8|nr:hypothetical protein [Enterococcus timonensis]
MKKVKIVAMTLIIFSLGLIGLTSCKNTSEKNQNFTEETILQLKQKAKTYTAAKFQDGTIPLNDFVQLSGVITKTDGDADNIQKGDRFVIEDDQTKVQVFNQQNTILKLGDQVTVYSEYYGFITASLIEKTNAK